MAVGIYLKMMRHPLVSCVQTKINELMLYNENSQRELSTIVREKQELMVDDNLLKLEIKRLREMVNLRADDVLSLEKRKLQLQTVRSEIDMSGGL